MLPSIATQQNAFPAGPVFEEIVYELLSDQGLEPEAVCQDPQSVTLIEDLCQFARQMMQNCGSGSLEALRPMVEMTLQVIGSRMAKS